MRPLKYLWYFVFKSACACTCTCCCLLLHSEQGEHTGRGLCAGSHFKCQSQSEQETKKNLSSNTNESNKRDTRTEARTEASQPQLTTSEARARCKNYNYNDNYKQRQPQSQQRSRSKRAQYSRMLSNQYLCWEERKSERAPVACCWSCNWRSFYCCGVGVVERASLIKWETQCGSTREREWVSECMSEWVSTFRQWMRKKPRIAQSVYWCQARQTNLAAKSFSASSLLSLSLPLPSLAAVACVCFVAKKSWIKKPTAARSDPTASSKKLPLCRLQPLPLSIPHSAVRVATVPVAVPPTRVSSYLAASIGSCLFWLFFFGFGQELNAAS